MIMNGGAAKAMKGQKRAFLLFFFLLGPSVSIDSFYHFCCYLSHGPRSWSIVRVSLAAEEKKAVVGGSGLLVSSQQKVSRAVSVAGVNPSAPPVNHSKKEREKEVRDSVDFFF